MLLERSLCDIFYYKRDYVSFLKQFAPLAHTLNYYPPEFIREVTDYCRKQIYKIYPHPFQYISKAHADSLPRSALYKYFINRTSGTTGDPFEYPIWSDIYKTIEADNHYKLVATEYGLNDPNILYMHRQEIVDNAELVTKYKSPNPILSHGFGTAATIHHAQANNLLVSNQLEYYRQIIEYSIDNNIDIILASGGILASLAYAAYKLNCKDKICKLVSNTNSKVEYDRLEYLKRNGLIEHWCDHMRCWDGGATFFTCKHGIKHLLDGLSWCQSINNKLVSDDYFSIITPFYRYWNGDYADIDYDYQLCQCGRYYRRFELNRMRTRNLPGVEKSTIYDAICHINNVLRIESFGNVIRVFTSSTITPDSKQHTRDNLPGHIVLFEVEEWTNDRN